MYSCPIKFVITQPENCFEYNKYPYENKTIKNTLEHAEQDSNNAEEHLKRAKVYEASGNNLQFHRACRSATKDAIDSTEKYMKVVVNMQGIQDNTFQNERDRREKLQKTHIIKGLNEAIDPNFLSNGEAEFMDKFTDIENGCYTSHTGLSYGDVTPTYEDAEKAVKYNKKVKDGVERLREKIFIRKIVVQASN